MYLSKENNNKKILWQYKEVQNLLLIMEMKFLAVKQSLPVHDWVDI